MAHRDGMGELYLDLLKDAHSQEEQLVEAIPKMASAASTPALRDALQMHHRETQWQFDTVRDILRSMDVNPGGKVCVGMEGLIREGEEVLKKKGKLGDEVVDAGIIAAAQKVEHYEISNYGTLREFARVLGHREHANKFDQILDQEYAADRKLSALAESGLNRQAERQ